MKHSKRFELTMKQYKIQIYKEALQDIREAVDWYNFHSKGLSTRFQKQVSSQINSLQKTPTIYALRYADVRCMTVKNFPFLVHFTVDESNFSIQVYAILHTSRNPKIWEERG
jgi:plasmid stabilization system protein ParE